MSEELPYRPSSLSEEQLNALFNLFLQKTHKVGHPLPPKRNPKKPVREETENFMEHIDDYFKKHR